MFLEPEVKRIDFYSLEAIASEGQGGGTGEAEDGELPELPVIS